MLRLLTMGFLLAACGDGGGGGGESESESESEGEFPGFTCGDAFSATFDGARVEAQGASYGDLEGFALEEPTGRTLDAMDVEAACADDIVPDGMVAVSPAIAVTPAPDLLARDVAITIPVRHEAMPDAHRGHVRLYWKRAAGNMEPFSPPVANLLTDFAAGRASFLLDEFGTFQLAVPATAGQARTRRHVYRGIAGFSMGGIASAVMAARHPEMFDVVAPLGGDPGIDLVYMAGFFNDYFLGGFCDAGDEAAGTGAVGELCPTDRQPLDRQFERPETFEALIYEDGEGTGLTLRRDLYMRGQRDISRAFGNSGYANPDSLFLPPGIPESYLELPPDEQCASPVVLEGFYDREYNPDGAFPVITFCDGVDSSAMGLGVFDESLVQTDPAQILLAVDVNANDERDSGEPVIVHGNEPFDDVGLDGARSPMEPGYDPIANPDPAGDDYDYLKNPGGSENNWLYDDGEPYEDLGVDGVAGTCQAIDDAGCYDAGEGDGEFTYSPGTLRWWDRDLHQAILAWDDDTLAGVDFLFDAGIRDFLNAHVATNQIAGFLQARAGALHVYGGFYSLDGTTNDQEYTFTAVDYATLGKNVYVRYGNPDATEEQIRQGDGRHVGTALQLVHRVTTLFAFADARWPNGDRELVSSGLAKTSDLTFTSPSTGQERPFSLFLPPGYNDPENADVRYPVLYFLHGYGMEPADLVVASILPSNLMVNPNDDIRFQKYMVVFVDGRCRPGFDLPETPDPETGDRCEEGTFYQDSVGDNTAQMETLLLELVDHIDGNYRTKQPEDVEVVE